MAELTHLNEASVVHNLHLRYQGDLIYVRASKASPHTTANTILADLLGALPRYRQSLLLATHI